MPKAKKAEPDISSVQVRLPKVLGLPPGVYLAVLYALAALLLLFLILFYPGLKRRGTYVTVESFPPAAAVLVDGAYAGATPCTVLVAPGAHTLRIEKPFFHARELEAVFGGRIFATLFVKPRERITVDLETRDVPALLDYLLDDFSANPHIPEILTDAVRAGYTADAVERSLYYDFLDNAKYFITNAPQLARLVAASTALSAGGSIMAPGSLIELCGVWVRELERWDNLPFWLLLALPAETARILARGAWFEHLSAGYGASLQSGRAAPPARGASVTVRDLRFLAVSAGRLLQGYTENGTVTPLLAHTVDLPGFYMAETEVSNRLYQSFVDAEPRWRKSNLEALQNEGLVTESYLDGWDNDRYPAGAAELPVTQVSYFAARAFCDWLSASTGLPAGAVIRLPYEPEWEYAARGGLEGLPYPTGSDAGSARFLRENVSGPRAVGYSEPNGYGLRDMSGNVWEWCADRFAPMGYFFTSWEAAQNRPGASAPPAGAERVVRGGSWANRSELVKLYTRGSQPADWCTPYLGFRPVLVRP